MLGAWEREAQPKIWREPEGRGEVEGLTHVIPGSA